jgi:hypothetical protein
VGFAQVSISYKMLDAMARGGVTVRIGDTVPEEAELVTIRAVPYLDRLVLVYKHPNFKSEWKEDVQALPSLLPDPLGGV